MDARHKPRLHSVDNIIQTQVLGGEVSDKQMDAVYEEALEAVLTALNGEAGLSDLDAPFLEVEQPASDFLLRLDKDGRPALYEADGGAWKLEAKRNIAAYLGEQLADLVERGSVVVMI